MIILITFIANSLVFASAYFAENRLPKMRHIEILEPRKVRSSLFYLSLSILTAGTAYFLKNYWLSMISSLVCLTGISFFFNAMKDWFLKTRHRRIKHEDLAAAGLWLLWLFAGSIFLANIILCLQHF